MNADLLMNLADRYACAYESGEAVYGEARRDLENAVKQLFAERDTLAAGVLSPDDDAITKAIEVAERLKAASDRQEI